MANDSVFSTQLIEGDGTFNSSGLEKFMEEVKLSECELSYAVVSIMGPQSSGKSTLLNHLFHTNFKEMDALKKRSRTTKGIWMAKCAGIEPCTIVMDLEGSDGRERGKDDTAFERQSALFALAVSDIVLINMWCQEIGREAASNKRLLETVFQVMMQLFSSRKTTLMFVIRDKTKNTPLEILELDLKEEIQKIWDSVLKPQAQEGTPPLSEFFNVKVVALSSYDQKEKQFKEEVANLRQRFNQSIARGGLAGDRRGVVPASGFSFSLQEIWRVIKENKDLNLPAHKVLVANLRCEEIANDKFKSFTANKEWSDMEENVKSHPVEGFGMKLSSILDTCLKEYDAEARCFDDDVRSTKRKQLEEKLLQLVRPAYRSMFGHIRSRTLDKFKDEFSNALGRGQGFAEAARHFTQSFMKRFDVESADAIIKQADWDVKEKDKLRRDIDAQISAFHSSKLSDLTTSYENKLSSALAAPVEALLVTAADDTWPEIRKLLRHESEVAVSGFSSALFGFEIDDQEEKKMLSRLKDYARGIVEEKAKEEAGKVMNLMKDRFKTLFSQDSNSVPRVWTEEEDITEIAITARSASLKMLSVMAAIRLDDDADHIEKTMSVALINKASTSVAALSSSTWEKVPASKTLITPVECKNLWTKLMSDTEDTIAQAIMNQSEIRSIKHTALAAQNKAVAAVERAAAAEYKARAAEDKAAEDRAAARAAEDKAAEDRAAAAAYKTLAAEYKAVADEETRKRDHKWTYLGGAIKAVLEDVFS